jgi:hypothetical protein
MDRHQMEEIAYVSAVFLMAFGAFCIATFLI